MIALTLAAAVLIGIALGLFGGGGSILAVPVLVYLAGVPAKTAIAMSLFIVAVTSGVTAIGHARAGRIRWRTGLVFGAAGMAGAYGGGLIGPHLPEALLMAAFAAMMLATAIAMIRDRRAPAVAPPRRDLPIVHVIAEGAVVGLVTGLVGAGGGFLVVPALVLLGGLPMGVAVGTSLLVIAMKSVAGLAGYLHSVPVDWSLALPVTGAAVAGGLVGGVLAGRLDADRLRRAFGWFVLVMGAFVILQQAPAALFHTPWVLGVPIAVTAVIAGVLCRKVFRTGARTPGRT
ncbi:sulfite exporter TauE/SafE family protein [Nonomuraea basaltis]|uniref:sulfite exporter TauE/SafE family protein n=1 Tax=Nonomuraea basaltis TaxID=2495887 RepID=UPI00110C4225|nr:sulfite exporter TauE/SafE family protein [Nonomuraea basaltis]TMS00596.1 sulfite exporter TauE/SafE family protein [Nonomuraea basaltis]